MDLRPMEFKDTASMMLSGDCKERFQAEYGQLRLRYQKLKGDTYETKISNEFTAVCRGWSIWRPGRRRRSFWSSRNRQQHRRFDYEKLAGLLARIRNHLPEPYIVWQYFEEAVV